MDDIQKITIIGDGTQGETFITLAAHGGYAVDGAREVDFDRIPAHWSVMGQEDDGTLQVCVPDDVAGEDGGPNAQRWVLVNPSTGRALATRLPFDAAGAAQPEEALGEARTRELVRELLIAQGKQAAYDAAHNE